MDRNVRIAKELIRIAKSLVANEKIVKLRDLLKMNIDVDTSDGIIDEEIVFCGPCKLTEEGERKFGPLLDKDIRIYDDGSGKYATALNLTESEGRLFREFLKAAAGYVASSLHEKWFDHKGARQDYNNEMTKDKYLDEMKERYPNSTPVLDRLNDCLEYMIVNKKFSNSLIEKLKKTNKVYHSEFVNGVGEIIKAYCEEKYKSDKAFDNYPNISKHEREEIAQEIADDSIAIFKRDSSLINDVARNIKRFIYYSGRYN